MPHSLDVEASFLGAVFLDPSIYHDYAGIIDESCFFSFSHRRIWRAIGTVAESGGNIDLVSVQEQLRATGELDSVGGTEYLARLVEHTPSAAGAPTYAQLLQSYTRLRQLMEGAIAAESICREPGADIDAAIDRVEAVLTKALSATEQSATAPTELDELLTEALDVLEERARSGGSLVGLSSGYPSLDELTGGLQPGNLIVVAGRPSMGKTAFALSLAHHVLRAGGSAAIYSLEMSRHELILRLLAAEAMIDSVSMQTGSLTPQDWTRLHAAAERLHGRYLTIDDHGGLTLADLRARLRKLAARRKPDLVVVDYIQLMESGNSRREYNRVQDISEISRGLKLLARELQTVVVAVSQLNRAPEARQDKRPLLGDLRESGAIEQDADIVIFLYRDAYYDRESSDRGVGEVIVAKHRNGPTGMRKLAFIEAAASFAEIAS
jgi:replicative DNA helicase